MSLTVLSDEHIRGMLESLNNEEATSFAFAMKSALHEYSTGQQSIDDGLLQQPERTVTQSKATGATTLFMPSCSPAGHGVKVVTLSSANADPSLPTIRPTGSVTIFSPSGQPLGFLHAKTLTAFRTALASTCLLLKRSTVKTLTVFGCGLQAYWHIRLALMMRGHTIRTINIINRQFSDNAKMILKRFYAVPMAIKRREGWEAAQFSLLTPSFGDYRRLEAENIINADVIYCCTPSTKDLFSAEILTDYEGRRKGRLIVAIGSYTPKMRELPRELLLQAVKTREGGHRHYHKHAIEGGVVVVDTIDGALKEAGEIIEAGLQPRQLVELGELVMIHKAAMEEEETLAHASQSSETSSLVESLENMKPLTPGSSAMSTVFGSTSDSASKRSTSQSPSRSSSGHSSMIANSLGHAFHRRSSSHSSVDRKVAKEKREDHFARWMHDGTVIYKSVGMGLMDLVVGHEIVKLAQKRGVGTTIENFSAPSS